MLIKEHQLSGYIYFCYATSKQYRSTRGNVTMYVKLMRTRRGGLNILILVYDLKFVGPLEFESVALHPCPNNRMFQFWTFLLYPTLHVLPDTSGKCIVVVLICSGMGATKLKFWVLRS